MDHIWVEFSIATSNMGQCMVTPLAKSHKEIVRHTQSESAKCYQASPAQNFVACGIAKRYLSGYTVSQKPVGRNRCIYSYEPKPIYIFPY